MERRRFLLGLAALIGGAAAVTAAAPEAQALPAPVDPAKDLQPVAENASAMEPAPAAEEPLDSYYHWRRRRVYRVYRVRRVYRRRVYRRRYYRRYW